MAENSHRPYLFPSILLSLLPAGYAGQVYGWKLGASIYFVTLFSLYAVLFVGSWREWSVRSIVILRTLLILGFMVAIGLSAAEICSAKGECRSAWSWRGQQ